MKASLMVIGMASAMILLTGCRPAEVKNLAPTAADEKPATPAATPVTPRRPITIVLPPAREPMKPAFVTVEPFAGVTLELPRDWQALDSESTDSTTPSTPVETLVGHRGFAGPRASWSFVPPGHTGAELNISLNPQPAQKTTELPDETIVALAKSFGETLEPIVEGRGYRLKRRATWERVKSNGRPAVLWQDEAESPAGTLAAQVLFIPLEKASIIATFLWNKTPDRAWEAAMERARASLRVTEPAKAPAP